MTKWTTPDVDGNIHIPDELVGLVNAIAIQINSLIRSGKNEVQTICDIACIAQDFFSELQQAGKEEIMLLEPEVKDFVGWSGCTPTS